MVGLTSTRRRAVVVAAVAALVVGALVAAVLVVLDRLDRTPLERALAVAPPASRVSFTDWAAVRAAVDADLGDTPDREAVEQMVAAAYDRDLAAVSSVDEAAGAMQQLFGFGPGTAQWEVYAQSPEGAALGLRPPEGTDYDVLGENLRSAGYTAPDDEGGVWTGGVDLVAGLDPTLTPVVQYVVLLPDEGLVLASDAADYAERAAAVATGEEDAVGATDGVADLAARMEGALNTVMWVDDFACTDLAMARADDEDQAAAQARIEELGGVSPLSGLALGLVEGGGLRVVQHFADAGQAERDLEARAALAVGEAYGRGGAFPDDLELVRSRTVGADVVLDLQPVRPDGFPLSSLYDGPLVLAAC